MHVVLEVFKVVTHEVCDDVILLFHLVPQLHVPTLQGKELLLESLNPLISCLSWQYSGLYLSPTLPTLLPASDIPNQCTIGCLLHDYRNLPPTNYFHISLLSTLSFGPEVNQLPHPPRLFELRPAFYRHLLPISLVSQ